jgi:hypothetical protein
MVALTLASALGVFVLRATRRGRRTSSPPASRGAKKPLSPPRPAPPAEDPSALDAGACLRRLDAQTEAIAAAMAAGRWREVVERSQEVASEAWERRRRRSRRAEDEDEDAASSPGKKNASSRRQKSREELLFEFRAREAVALRHVANGLLEMGMLEQSARCCEILIERARELTPLNVPAVTSGEDEDARRRARIAETIWGEADAVARRVEETADARGPGKAIIITPGVA